MEIQKALELLRQYRDKINHLKTLPPYNKEYWLWKNKVDVVLKDTFGVDSDEYRWLNLLSSIKLYEMAEAEKREEYLYDLEKHELGITKILDKYEIIGIPTTSEVGERSLPSVFIAHGGKTAARDKLEDFLTVLGVTPIIVEEQPSQGRSKDKSVEYYLKQCDCAIILATKGDVDGRTGEFIPRGNILIEIGRCQEILPDRMIYLLEEGAKFPTNIDEKVWERFTQESIDKAFIKVAKELRAFGLIRATKLGG